MTCPVFDGHCDTAFELWRRGEHLAENSCHVDLKKARSLGPYVQVFAFCSYAGGEETMGLEAYTPEELLTLPLDYLRQEAERNREAIAFAERAQDIRPILREGKICGLLSVEGPEVLGCDPERLAELGGRGFFMTTLTWNQNNPLAGCHLSDRGLTDRGRAYVRAAREAGLLVDVSHLSEAAFWDLMKITQSPVLASHSNAGAVQNHSRNLTDRQLRALAETGGTVGLNLYGPFLGPDPDFETVLKHLEHMLRLCGPEHIALGGDLDGCDTLPRGFRELSSYRSLYTFLLERGWGKDLTDRLFFGNLMRLTERGVN